MEQVAAGAVAQTKRVGEVVVSMGQVSASVEEVAVNAAKAARLAEDAQEKARDGAAVVSDSVAAIGTVQELSEALRKALDISADRLKRSTGSWASSPILPTKRTCWL